ncbi:Gamma-tubulin complex component protein [Sesbania bispinosa]|nr:Gamma-tubulin complex component protein [Sesbania bispinosa]
MLHELLLALLGYTGDLIIDRRDQLSAETPISDECTFKLAPDISFIDPSDRELIERIITLGFYYRELERFSAKSRNLNWIRSANANPVEKREKLSVYRRALANGIVEILSVYRSSILHIEQLLLSETMPILATVTQGLNKFFTLLPPLYELILEIERDDIRGGQLLNLLHKRCHCGVPELQTCIQRYAVLFTNNIGTIKMHVMSFPTVGLLWHGHQVMYNQLASWMVYGILQDQHGEFFIRSYVLHLVHLLFRQEDRDIENSSSHPEISEKLARLSTDDASLTDWHLGFHISLDMLPEYIPMRVAESILFAGKAVRVLRNPSPSFLSGDAVYPQLPKSFQKIHGLAGRFHFQREPVINSGMGVEDLLPQPEADKIEAMLLDLKLFFSLTFLISLKAIAASHLWQVLNMNILAHMFLSL